MGLFVCMDLERGTIELERTDSIAPFIFFFRVLECLEFRCHNELVCLY